MRGIRAGLWPAVAVSICIASMFISGCSGYSGPSEYEQQQAGKQKLMDDVRSQGGQIEQKHFEVFGKSGDAWVINLSGATISDEMIDAMETLGYIAEMNLSGSTITDEQLLRMDELRIGRVVMKLDLSNTAITDAALDGLENFYNLGQLNLKGTKVTPQGVDRFKKKQQSNPKVSLPFRKPKIEL